MTEQKPLYIEGLDNARREADRPRCRDCGCELAHIPGLGGLPDQCVECWAKGD